MNYYMTDKLIEKAFEEDFPYGDITSECMIPKEQISTARLFAKEQGILAGRYIFQRVFELLGNVDVTFFYDDGAEVSNGMHVAQLHGNTRSILKGERTALNFLQRMSGVATKTNRLAQLLSDCHTQLLDTRKTTPGWRALEKYAVVVGGGMNHRFGLSDGILIKDNHIQAMGGVTAAVIAARKAHGFVRKIEVETESLEMVQEALDAGVDIIMLDNMSIEMMADALVRIQHQALTECSGNITEDRIKELKHLGIDFISCGALTHSYTSLDFSLKIE